MEEEIQEERSADEAGKHGNAVVEDVDDRWVKYMEEKLASKSKNWKPSHPFTICRVPQDIRSVDNAAHDPLIVSIGPYHRGNPSLHEMEEVKWRNLNKIRGDSNKFKDYLRVMKEIEPEARACYAGNINMEADEFKEMMLLDGLFIIELLRKGDFHFSHLQEPICTFSGMLCRVGHDMLLLENQLPFFVLERLWDLTDPRRGFDLWKSAGAFFYDNALRFGNKCDLQLLPEIFDEKEKKTKKRVRENPEMMTSGARLGSSASHGSPGSQSGSVDIILNAEVLHTHKILNAEVLHTPTGSSASREGPLDPKVLQTHEILKAEVLPTPIRSPGSHWGRRIPRGGGLLPPPGLPVEVRRHNLLNEDGVHHLLHLVYLLLSSTKKSRPMEPTTGKSSESMEPAGSSDPESIEPTGSSDQSKDPTAKLPAFIKKILSLLPPRCHSEKQPPPLTVIPCSAELDEAGVEFQCVQAKSFLDIKFEQGTMKMPRLMVVDSTKSLLRNFIAYEQCFPNQGSHFTSYCYFMDYLVNTPRDVEILKRSAIIENRVGSDEEVAILFNDLCKGTFVSDLGKSYLGESFKDVIEHTQKTWPKWRARLTHDYFSNPWAIISLIAATYAIFLTSVQTYYDAFT